MQTATVWVECTRESTAVLRLNGYRCFSFALSARRGNIMFLRLAVVLFPSFWKHFHEAQLPPFCVKTVTIQSPRASCSPKDMGIYSHRERSAAISHTNRQLHHRDCRVAALLAMTVSYKLPPTTEGSLKRFFLDLTTRRPFDTMHMLETGD